MPRPVVPGRIAGRIGAAPDRNSPGMSHVVQPPGPDGRQAHGTVSPDFVEKMHAAGGIVAGESIPAPTPTTLTPVLTVFNPITPMWAFYGLRDEDREAEILRGRIRCGRPAGTFETEDGRQWREAAPGDRATGIRPRKGNDGPGSKEHGRYTRLVIVGATTLPIATTPHTEDTDTMTAPATTTSTRKTAAPKPAAKADADLPALPTKRGLDLKTLGDVFTATRYLVATEGATLTRVAMRTRLEAAFGTSASKGYQPGMVARALSAAGVKPAKEAKGAKTAPAPAGDTKAAGAAPTTPKGAAGPETGAKAAGKAPKAAAPVTRAAPKPGGKK